MARFTIKSSLGTVVRITEDQEEAQKHASFMLNHFGVGTGQVEMLPDPDLEVITDPIRIMHLMES
jgi:hypothetical protein